MKLYYKVLNEGDRLYISKKDLLTKGITSSTKSNFAVTKVGLGNSLIKGTPFDENISKPTWLDFEKAIPCTYEKSNTDNYICFNKFTDKIRVFNKDLSSDIVGQEYFELLDEDEERYAFNTGYTLEDLYSKYWSSMLTLEEYLSSKPYPIPEIFIFEDISAQLLYNNKKQ